jgi:hypothetical protein
MTFEGASTLVGFCITLFSVHSGFAIYYNYNATVTEPGANDRRAT